MQQNSNQLNVSGLKRWWLRRQVDIHRAQTSYPDKHLKLIAITGSAGKTSVAHLLLHILAPKVKVGLLATNGIWYLNQVVDSKFCVNTASSGDIYAALHKLQVAGAEVVIVETTYQQVAKQTFYKTVFDSAVLTNILDIENLNYAEQVFAPIAQTRAEGLVVINGDDSSVGWLMERAGKLTQQLYAAWCKKEQVRILQQATSGMSFSYLEQTFQTKLFTEISLENLMLAVRVAVQFMQPAEIVPIVASYEPTSARMQLITSSPYSVIVDKARTEYNANIWERLLAEFSRFKSAESRLIIVIDGLLGQECVESLSKYSKVLIVPPADPGNHDVTNINTKLFSLLESFNVVLLERFTSKEEYQAVDKTNMVGKIDRVVANGDLPVISFDEHTLDGRHDAIHLALTVAKLGDIVLFLGKGDDHELDFGEMHYDWNEVVEVKKLVH